MYKINEKMFNVLVGVSHKDAPRTILLKEIVTYGHTTKTFYSDAKVTFNNYLIERFKISGARASQILKDLITNEVLIKKSNYVYLINEEMICN